ncbi:hypothetical protein C4D60_Mb06t29230 [Musa balbisiana]|uniref:Uncharacterized protein n=1 Tax=Musa balbisiana TaxID=52838 RepID=A0A4S8IRM9_MUSBA|nr:hypothetical protein C4D60_Mb06t29230 [Musa balbisiana]
MPPMEPPTTSSQHLPLRLLHRLIKPHEIRTNALGFRWLLQNSPSNGGTPNDLVTKLAFVTILELEGIEGRPPRQHEARKGGGAIGFGWPPDVDDGQAMGVAELSEGNDRRRWIGGLRVRSGFGFGRISGDRLGFGFRSLLGRRRNPKLRLRMIGARIGVSRGSGGDVGGIGVELSKTATAFCYGKPTAMSAASKSRVVASLASSWPLLHHGPWRHLGFLRSISSSPALDTPKPGSLELKEVEKILGDVKADDVRVISVRDQCDWTDYMVVATGRSTWHVKQKQKGAERLVLPSVEGHEGGKWIVIDSGNVIVHALEEKARAYYNLESLWTTEMTPKGPNLSSASSIQVDVQKPCLIGQIWVRYARVFHFTSYRPAAIRTALATQFVRLGLVGSVLSHLHLARH